MRRLLESSEGYSLNGGGMGEGVEGNEEKIHLMIPKSTLIENFICKTFSKVAFYSTVHTMYVHTSKNAKK